MARDNSQDFIWFLSGMAIGVTVGLLFAPQPGEETRSQIKSAARRGSDKLRESSEELYSRGRDLFERGKELADEASSIFERGRSLVDG
ncbi:MAG: YtxH domain-containing protein [Bryobacter sp.]|jgi:gas vesicle protein|nr:YtxH domain-containing protein [Bryobacter sp. CoA8 C33]